MPIIWLLGIILALATIAYFVLRRRALSLAGNDGRNLHSLPSFYGWHAFMMVAVPAFLFIIVWLLVQPVLIERSVNAMIPESLASGSGERSLVMADVRRIADGLDTAVSQGMMSSSDVEALDTNTTDVRAKLAEVGVAVGSDVKPEVLAAAKSFRSSSSVGSTILTILALLMAIGGFALAWLRTKPDFRARNVVETGTKGLLIGAASIAILTTAGIVLSMLFESVNFFSQYSWSDFFFGTTWVPRFQGNSELGILPLLWGTLYISVIALLVAVPIGLFAAVYMSEYASDRVRAIAKPALEVLAGIPTIVYGLFALITVGPLLRDYFASPLGLGNSGSSVMTAGLVMGIMLIPFVSSLSDDIINSVPQAMRDGSYGLGATQSETIKQVILPAALPGIVGAVLLAASRAIGETMIVVLGAGASARMGVNPFEAMTTVTVKIVSQLTGDTDFNSPETLVAFALGLTLFVMTLGLNVLALYIVRKYREQYE